MKHEEYLRFYEAYFERVFRFVYFRVGGDREIAQDLTQDIFLKAFLAFERFDPSKATVSWIYTIARNQVINHVQRTQRLAPLEEAEKTGKGTEDVREGYAQTHEGRMLLKAIDALPEEEAKLVRLKYLEGWTFDDLAELFEKTSGSLRVQANRVLKKLRATLKGKFSL